MESRKNGTDEPICRAGIETQTQGMDLWAQMRDAEGGTNCESSVKIYTLQCVKQITNGTLLNSAGSSTGALWQTRRVAGKIKRNVICVYSRLVHVIVWQKPTQHSKAIILQLKMNFKRDMNVHHSLALSPESRVTWSQRIILFVVLFIGSLSAWEFLYHSFPYKVLSCIPQLQTEQEIISAGKKNPVNKCHGYWPVDHPVPFPGIVPETGSRMVWMRPQEGREVTVCWDTRANKPVPWKPNL